MLALYGLKWNPFRPNVLTEPLHVTTSGIVLLAGAATRRRRRLRLGHRRARLRQVRRLAHPVCFAGDTARRDVGVISRPQANIADFYREMGEPFGVEPLRR